VRIGILGPLEVTGDNGPVAIGGARLRALVIRLALDVGKPVPAAALAEALWEGDRPSDPANAVQSLVSRLRRALPVAGVLRSEPGSYVLDLPPDAVDATRFERLAAEGRRLLRIGDPQAAAVVLGEALALWRGPALADVAGLSYAVAPAARLEELRLVATEDRLEAELRNGDGPRLVAELEQLAAAHPLRERPTALLMQAQVAAGRPAEGLAAYERLRSRLATELGVDPSEELRALHRAVLRGEAAVPSRAVPRGNLRAALTSFVGRAAERQQVLTQLARGRLVTLVGPGGSGKTRLAVSVAAELADRTPGGVWLVELAGVTGPADVPYAVWNALGQPGVRFTDARPSLTGSGDVTSLVVEALSGAPTVLVLDNCEHLVEAAARLAEELLGRCPQLRILATSREPLGLIGEALSPVPPLPLPAPSATLTEALASPAVQLFADRAAAVRPGFTVDEGNVAAVVEICRRLDGLPLAIELAAARLRTLSEAQVAQRLGDRFRLLTGGSRTALPRHRTLRAVVDWSWDLLSEDEQRLLRRLAVFPGGIAVPAAASVAGDERLPRTRVEDLLDALVDKSLLEVLDHDEPRYRLLDTIRAYAWDRLVEAGEVDRSRAAHARYFLSLAETAEPRLRGAEQLVWFARLAVEHDNLLGALNAACDRGDAATAVRLAAAMTTYFMMRGDRIEAAAWPRQALAVPGDSPPEPRAIAKAACVLNGIWARQTDEQRALAEEVLAAIADLRQQGPLHPILVLVEPMLATFADDRERGLVVIDKAFPAADQWTTAMLHLLRSFVMENDGDPVARRAELETAAGLFRDLGERWGLGTALSGLAELQAQLGDFDAALATLAESIHLMHEVGATEDILLARTRAAVIRARRGEVGRARAELRELLRSEPTAPVYLGFVWCSLAEIARCEGDLAEAAELYRKASTEFGDLAPTQFSVMVGVGQAHLALACGDLSAAESYLATALDTAHRLTDMPVIARTAVALAELWLRRGSPERAAVVLGASEVLRGGPDLLSADLERVATAVRAALGAAAYEAAYARGRSCDRPRALAMLALDAAGQVRRR
jgi:predicted ATPase/DNA-binding SARP family transcriptional activator